MVQGNGSSIVDGIKINWADKDTFVVPSKTFHEHSADSEAVLFSYTDSPVLKTLDLYWEEEYAENGGHQEVTETLKAGPTA